MATEFIDGQTLTQWMIDHPKPSLDMVRGIVDQVGKGLQAFHRLEMLHQDLRPDPLKRYESLSEFVHDLHHPNQAFLSKTRPALVERNPLLFWKSLSLGLALGLVVLVLALLMARYGVR